jgi:hypothetical protein
MLLNTTAVTVPIPDVLASNVPDAPPVIAARASSSAVGLVVRLVVFAAAVVLIALAVEVFNLGAWPG